MQFGQTLIKALSLPQTPFKSITLLPHILDPIALHDLPSSHCTISLGFWEMVGSWSGKLDFPFKGGKTRKVGCAHKAQNKAWYESALLQSQVVPLLSNTLFYTQYIYIYIFPSIYLIYKDSWNYFKYIIP